MQAVGDVTAELQTAAATLVFAAQAQNFQTVTWHHVQGRLRPGQNQKVMVALDVFRTHTYSRRSKGWCLPKQRPGTPLRLTAHNQNADAWRRHNRQPHCR